VQVVVRLKLGASSSVVPPGDGVMDAPPGDSSSGLGVLGMAPLVQPPQMPPLQNHVNHQSHTSSQGSLLHAETDRQDARRPWLPKMDFPHFEGFDARIWLDCVAYFAMYQIPTCFLVSVTSIHMSRSAA
jgi:hypothetical protein